MILYCALVLAEIRPLEGWTAVSIVAGVVLLALLVAAAVAWIVRVVTRR